MAYAKSYTVWKDSPDTTTPMTAAKMQNMDDGIATADTLARAAAVAVGYGTSLPGSPDDGTEYILVDSTSLPTYQWRFRYHSASSNTDKWEFVGGNPALVEVATSETTASAAYAALATAGPSFTVPRAGVYIVEIGAQLGAAAAAAYKMSYDIGGTGAVDADALERTQGVGSTDNVPGSRARVKSGLSASTALVAKYKTSASTLTAADRWMRVTPVRVS